MPEEAAGALPLLPPSPIPCCGTSDRVNDVFHHPHTDDTFPRSCRLARLWEPKNEESVRG